MKWSSTIAGGLDSKEKYFLCTAPMTTIIKHLQCIISVPEHRDCCNIGSIQNNIFHFFVSLLFPSTTVLLLRHLNLQYNSFAKRKIENCLHSNMKFNADRHLNRQQSTLCQHKRITKMKIAIKIQRKKFHHLNCIRIIMMNATTRNQCYRF